MSGRTFEQIVQDALHELRVLEAQGKSPDDEGVGLRVSTVSLNECCDVCAVCAYCAR